MVIVEYHLFSTRPLEKCFSDSEEVTLPEGVPEVLHVIRGLKDRISKSGARTDSPVQGYAFMDKVPAVLIRSDGSIHLLARYGNGAGNADQAITAIVRILGK